MTTDVELQTQAIVVDEVFPHAPEVLWRTLTTGDLIGRWMMPPTGFAPVKGNRFTFKTDAAGAWDGTIQCEVLEVVPNERFAYAWRGGHESNAGYGSRLDTIVTWLLSKAEAGTRLRLIHSGFRLPTNETAYTNMSKGWSVVMSRLKPVADQQD